MKKDGTLGSKRFPMADKYPTRGPFVPTTDNCRGNQAKNYSLCTVPSEQLNHQRDWIKTLCFNQQPQRRERIKINAHGLSARRDSGEILPVA